MTEIRAIRLPDNRTIYVELEPMSVKEAQGSSLPQDLPEGAEPTAFREDLVDALQALHENVDVMAATIHESLSRHAPDEWQLELNIGFRGKLNPIPVIVSSEANAAIKIVARWKRSGSN